MIRRLLRHATRHHTGIRCVGGQGREGFPGCRFGGGFEGAAWVWAVRFGGVSKDGGHADAGYDRGMECTDEDEDEDEIKGGEVLLFTLSPIAQRGYSLNHGSIT